MEKKYGSRLLLVTLGLLTLVACSTQPKPDLLLGKWKVFYVNHGGTLLYGRSFKGTEYTFREDHTIFAEGHEGDTLTSRYRHNGDSLVWIGQGVEEVYHLDTLNAERLTISAVTEGVPTTIRMLKIQK
jgi:hypothetical protein